MRAILTYHSIDDSGSPISLDAATFRRHVRWLAASGVRVLPLEEILSIPPDANAVAITFDDGFANFAEVAWPLLREHGLPATLFVATDYVGRDNELRSHGRSFPRLPLLDWPGIARLVGEGVTIGSHSVSHPDLRSLANPALTEELRSAAERIQAEVGTWPACFSYPYGWHSEEVAAAVGRFHRIACTTELRTLRDDEDPLRLPRLDTYYFRRPGHLEAWGSARFRAYLWLRQRLRRLRATLGASGWSG